jgi:PAS domain S-box-containing protein
MPGSPSYDFSDYPFLRGDGEMGRLIRSLNWANNPLGQPSDWPVALKQAVSMMLKNNFPVLICWGPHYIQLYNDAFRPINGDNKHPQAMGGCARETYAEIWETIGPMFAEVMNGKTHGFHDFMVPLDRNGRLEECYFDFSYSPITDLDGNIGGVLVICMETTEKVKAQAAISIERDRLRNFFLQAPAGICVLDGPELRFELVNPLYQQLFPGRELLGKPLLEAVSEVRDSAIWDILQGVYQTGNTFEGNELLIPLARTTEGPVEDRYFNFIYQARTDGNGIVDGILVFVIEVTDMVLVKQRFIESERQLEQMLDLLPAHVVVIRGPDLHVEMINDSNLAYWNKKKEETIGQPLLALLPELADQPFPGQLNRVMETGEIISVKESIVTFIEPDGSKRNTYVDYSYQPLTDAKGQRNGVLVMSFEVTDKVESRKLLEQYGSELSASNVRFKYLIQEAPVAIGVLNGRELVVESANDMILQIWGKTKSILGLPLATALPELQGQPFLQILDGVYTSGQAFHGDGVRALLAHEGGLREFFFNFVYRPIKNQSDNTTDIIVVAVDVTLQVNAQRQVRDSEEKLQLLADNIAQLAWMADDKGDIFWFNQRWFDYTGTTLQEMEGRGWETAHHPDHVGRVVEKYDHHLIEKGVIWEDTFPLRGKDGEFRWFLSRAVPLHDQEGKIIRWFGTNTDITEQKEDQQRKDEFLSIASHELKTPLTSIKAYNQIIQRINDPQKLKPFVVKSADHILRLERLIADLLDVTKINAGKMNYVMEPFNLATLLKDSIESIRHSSGGHEIILESAPDVEYTGDLLRLEQVMHNFLSNAVKYSPDGKKVIVNSKVDHGNIIVSVQDFGIGIARENLDKLFDRYYRVDNTAMRFEGLGLGLFISAEILRRHGGSFWIESEQGKGSTFYFRLPLAGAEKPVVTRTATFYRDQHISINFNQTKRRLEVDWTGFHDLESVKHGCMLMLETLQQNQCDRVVNDNTHVLGNWSEATDWVGNVWFPMMEQAGMKYFAHIFSPSTFSQLAAIKSIDIMAGIITTQYFTDIKLAEEWIDAQK